MKLILLSNPFDIPSEHRMICQFIENGLRIFHIRKPAYSLPQLREYLGKFPDCFHRQMVIHSHHDLLQEFDLKGIHLGEAARQAISFQHISALPCQKSTSFHQLSQLSSITAPYQYVFLSPIFNSISKKGYSAAFPHQPLSAALARTTHPVIALGGVDLHRIAQVKQLGFKGIALLGAIWQDNPLARFLAFRDHLQRHL